MSSRILVVTAQGEVRYLASESEAVRVLTIQPTGARGEAGAAGVGVPTGGAANDILKKTSATNYATEWETPTSTATANAIVRRDASGGAAFDDLTAATVVFTGSIQSTAANAFISTTGDYAAITTEGLGAGIGTNGVGSSITTAGTDSSIATLSANSPIFTTAANSSISTSASDSNIETQHASASVRSYNFAAFDDAGASLRNSAGTAILTWGATAGNISITVDTTSTGHFFSNPGTATAGHFITKNGTTPTIVAGRSAWFSDSSGSPQFKNGTSSAITLIYSGGALGTPASGILTSCTGLPISTGLSGLGTGVATALAVSVGSAGAFVVNGGALGTPLTGTLTNCTGLPISTGVSGLGTGVATLLTGTPSGTGGAVGKTSPTITTMIAKGAGTTTGSAFQVQNSSGTVRLNVRDDGFVGGSSIGTVDDSTAIIVDSSTVSTGNPRGLNLGSASVVGWGSNQWYQAKDIGLSRVSTGVLGVGTGAAGSVAGELRAAIVTVSGIVTATGGIIYGTFTVGTFPSTTYLEAVVTDALAPVIGSTVAAGGSAKCKVMYNGSAKIVTAVL
jgi:hypothetical protein